MSGTVGADLFIDLVRNCRFIGACMLWQGATNSKGYPVKWHEGQMRRVAHLMFEWREIEIPKGREVDHICNNRRCLKAEHLEIVSRRENARRKMDRREIPIAPVLWSVAGLLRDQIGVAESVGDADTATQTRMLLRALGRIVVEPGGCWRWTGARNKTCPVVYPNRGAALSLRKLMAHHILKQPPFGNIHTLCNRTDCISPEHFVFSEPPTKTAEADVELVHRFLGLAHSLRHMHINPTALLADAAQARAPERDTSH